MDDRVMFGVRNMVSSLLIVLLCLLQSTHAQVREKQDQKKSDLFDFDVLEKTAPSTVQSPGIALESTVHPETYFVGPSDVLGVNIWTSPPLSYPATVTPEGTLIIPAVGEMTVSDLTLANAKEKIIKEVRKKYLMADVTVTLIKPRPVIINVVGTVMNPGMYTLSAVDRSNKAIAEANKLTRMQMPEDLETVLRVMSTRNILLKHKDGSQDHVDLPKYYATRDEKWNPFLREGDIVVVPKKDPMKDVFGVYGEVNSSGRFEYVDGDSVRDAVRIANGLTRMAIADTVIFSRMNEDGTALTDRIINLKEIMAGRDPDVALQPGDRIIVRKRSDLRGDYNVDVKGEVVYPATYPITRNRTRLSEIIQQAGGFTRFASLNSANVYRQSYQPDEVSNERLANIRGGFGNADSTGFALETELRLKRETVTVDFVKLFEQKDSTQDIILQPEDQIVIPARHPSVYVFGQVVSPGHIPYVEGKEAKYYVEQAGGFTGHANKGDLTVIKSKTKQWLSPGDTKIEEGDGIWVPTEPDRPFSYYMTITSQAASVLSVIIGVAVVIVQVTK